MKIELHEIKIEDVVRSYVNSEEEGVVGYDGKLNIRPKYQREFVYDDKKRNAVIDSIRKGFPLNVMYWIKNNDGTFELLDGQQRTISFCSYVHNEYSIEIEGYAKIFDNLTATEKNKILNYPLMIYFCKGNDEEILNWYKVINIAGEKLTDQELRNAIYTGEWLTDAKSVFSKTNCAAYLLAKKYVNGSPIRQELLETSIKWITNSNIEKYENNIAKYMSIHQHDLDANELWEYFKNVINWIGLTFTTYRKEMKGINWGNLFNSYHNKMFDATALEKEIDELMLDDEVTSKKGIYSFVLTREEKYLNLRAFSEKLKREAYDKQKGICNICKKEYKLEKMEADHITPWSAGGKTNLENCQMLCKECNRRKSNI
jgi:hypothetical protein